MLAMRLKPAWLVSVRRWRVFTARSISNFIEFAATPKPILANDSVVRRNERIHHVPSFANSADTPKNRLLRVNSLAKTTVSADLYESLLGTPWPDSPQLHLLAQLIILCYNGLTSSFLAKYRTFANENFNSADYVYDPEIFRLTLKVVGFAKDHERLNELAKFIVNFAKEQQQVLFIELNKGYAGCRRFDLCQQTLDLMIDVNLKVDLATIIKFSESIEQVEKKFLEIADNRHIPFSEFVIYISRIAHEKDHHIKFEQTHRAFEVFKRQYRNTKLKSDYVHAGIMKLLCSLRRYNEVLQVYDHALTESGLLVTPDMAASVITAAAAESNYLLAYDAYQRVYDSAIRKSMKMFEVYSVAVGAFGYLERSDACIKVYKHAMEAGIGFLYPPFFQALFDALCGLKQWPYLLRVYEEIKLLNVTFAPDQWTMLMYACYKLKNQRKQASQIHKDLLAQGQEPDPLCAYVFDKINEIQGQPRIYSQLYYHDPGYFEAQLRHFEASFHNPFSTEPVTNNRTFFKPPFVISTNRIQLPRESSTPTSNNVLVIDSHEHIHMKRTNMYRQHPPRSAPQLPPPSHKSSWGLVKAAASPGLKEINKTRKVSSPSISDMVAETLPDIVTTIDDDHHHHNDDHDNINDQHQEHQAIKKPSKKKKPKSINNSTNK